MEVDTRYLIWRKDTRRVIRLSLTKCHFDCMHFENPRMGEFSRLHAHTLYLYKCGPHLIPPPGVSN
jgi:hypothetical protein